MKFLALIGACLALAFASCGGGTEEAATSSVAAGGSGDLTGQAASRHRRSPPVRMSKAEIAKLPPLRIPKPSGPPPRRFKIIELRKGSRGPALTGTDVVAIRFIEDTYPEAQTGSQGGLSGGEVSMPHIWLGEASRGLRVGLPGMRVGGRRELIVPPKVAYPRWKPSWGYAPYVSIYVVDLLGKEPPADPRLEYRD